MADMCIERFGIITELLQYFTGSVIITQSTGKLASTGIGTGWAVGDTLLLSATANSNIEVTVTYIHTDDSYMLTSPLSTAFGTGETAGACKLNQTAYLGWQDVRGVVKLIGVINTSGNADYWVQQSWDASTIDITSTKVDITGGTAVSYDIAVVAPYARLKILNEDADQTVMRGYLGGRSRS